MNPRERYFDNAATTPVDPRVLAEMLPFLADDFGNSESIHAWGQKAHHAAEVARQRVAMLIGAEDSSQIVFTSGSTEACNWILGSYEREPGWFGPFEHPAVQEPAERFGYRVLPNEGLEVMPPDPESIGGSAPLLSLMSVNNEIGTRWDPTQYRRGGIRVHSDMTQHLGKAELKVGEIDYASFSAHKLYGPKGVGALYYREDPPEPGQVGGGQENRLRAGTLNVPGIVGFGAACAIAEQEWERGSESAAECRGAVLAELAGISDWQINGGDHVVPHILSLSFWGLQGETLVIEMDQAGYGISSGAACSSRSTEPSRVLTALGVPDAFLRGTIRISFGRFNTADAAAELGRTLRQVVERMRAGLGRAGGGN